MKNLEERYAKAIENMQAAIRRKDKKIKDLEKEKENIQEMIDLLNRKEF